MGLREQWIRPLDALPQDYQHVIAITSSGQEEEMYLVDDKWHIVDGVRIPIEFVVFWHEKREQPKRGHWEVIRKEYEFMGSVVNEPQGCQCSNCGGIVKFKSDFCPNCGADMREVEVNGRNGDIFEA